jgi:hypothetical protein
MTGLESRPAAIGLDLSVNTALSLENAKNNGFYSLPHALEAPDSSRTEIALVNFHFTSERGCLFHFIGYDFPQAGEENNCGVAMHANDLRCCTGRCPSNKVLNEPCPFLGAISLLFRVYTESS